MLVPSIGPLELAIVLVIVLLIFGPKRLPGLGRQLGTGMREFKDSITGSGRDRGDRGGEGAARLEAAADAPAEGDEGAKDGEAVAAEVAAEDRPRADA